MLSGVRGLLIVLILPVVWDLDVLPIKREGEGKLSGLHSFHFIKFL